MAQTRPPESPALDALAKAEAREFAATLRHKMLAHGTVLVRETVVDGKIHRELIEPGDFYADVLD